MLAYSTVSSIQNSHFLSLMSSHSSFRTQFCIPSRSLPLLVLPQHSVYTTVKNSPPGTPLVVQWLRLCVPNAGSISSIPGEGTKIPHASQCSLKKKTPHLLNYSHLFPSLCSQEPWLGPPDSSFTMSVEILHLVLGLGCLQSHMLGLEGEDTQCWANHGPWAQGLTI